MTRYALDEVAPKEAEEAPVYIADGARVIGNVSFGPNTSVWFNAVVRCDNEPMTIGAGTNIQDGAVLHSDPGFPLSLGANVTVGHAAIVHGCTVEDDCLIGMGATVLNGAKIGRGSIVGANALVTEGKEFPAGSLIVGTPAKAVRSLTEEDAARIRRTAEHYVANAARYRKGLTELPE